MTSNELRQQQANERIAVVTGAAQGLGLAIAEKLGRSGALVLVADRQDADTAVDSLRREGFKGGAIQVRCREQPRSR